MINEDNGPAGAPVGWRACDAPSVAGGIWSGGDNHAGEGQQLVRSLIEAAAYLHRELRTGPGFGLLHNFSAASPGLAERKRCYLELGDTLGIVAPQNTAGDLLRHVTDEGGCGVAQNPRRAFGHRGRSAMKPHTDSADYVGLLCVCAAAAGGTNTVCSSEALHDRILQVRPEFLVPLYRGFHFDVSGVTHTGSGATAVRVPVFKFERRNLSCIFNRERILVGMRQVGIAMTALETAAVDYLHELAASDEFSIRLKLQAGDLLFLNNHRTLHGRDAYEDGPSGTRLLLRIWVNLRERERLRRIPIA